MDKSALITKLASSAVIAGVFNHLGVSGYLFITLIGLMVIDYITGILAAVQEKLDNPDDETLGLSSKKGKQGTIGKVVTILLIFACMILDYVMTIVAPEIGIEMLMSIKFTSVLLIYYNGTELVSIVENATRASNKATPTWLVKTIHWLSDSFSKYIAKKLMDTAKNLEQSSEETE